MTKEYEMIGISMEKDMLEDFLERLIIVQKFIDRPQKPSKELKTILEPMKDFFIGVLEDFNKYGKTITEEEIKKIGELKIVDLDK